MFTHIGGLVMDAVQAIYKREVERLEKKLKRQETAIAETKKLLAEVKGLVRS